MAELYDSNRCSIGGVLQPRRGAATSFSVANGGVYVGTMGGSTGTQGGFHMYGMLGRTCDGSASGQIRARAGSIPGK